ncbi:uncharacterized protein LOC110700844 [Chenopodium quinoa]|nr:uncharacterized protein LOC110700844 [Chenopodium quinoa]
MNEAARTSVLSRKWKFMWQCFPVLFFEANSPTMERIKKDDQLLFQERLGITRWVNSVLEAHRGLTIDELRVIFDLDVDCESYIDKSISLIDCYTWPLKCRVQSFDPRNLASLRSLCLKYVNLTVEDLECLLKYCPALEDLRIVGGASALTDIHLPHSPLQLKHLEVSCCPRLASIDIFVPKLVSFTYQGCPIVLCLRGASLLSAVSIGNGDYQGSVVPFASGSLSTYFQQLDYLKWDLLLNPRCSNIIQFSGNGRIYDLYKMKEIKYNGRPFTSLKTLELFGLLGQPIDMQFATFIVENSIMLKDVIFQLPTLNYAPFYKHAMNRIRKFKRCLPQGVNFILYKLLDRNAHVSPGST